MENEARLLISRKCCGRWESRIKPARQRVTRLFAEFGAEDALI